MSRTQVLGLGMIPMIPRREGKREPTEASPPRSAAPKRSRSRGQTAAPRRGRALTGVIADKLSPGAPGAWRLYFSPAPWVAACGRSGPLATACARTAGVVVSSQLVSSLRSVASRVGGHGLAALCGGMLTDATWTLSGAVRLGSHGPGRVSLARSCALGLLGAGPRLSFGSPAWLVLPCRSCAGVGLRSACGCRESGASARLGGPPRSARRRCPGLMVFPASRPSLRAGLGSAVGLRAFRASLARRLCVAGLSGLLCPSWVWVISCVGRGSFLRLPALSLPWLAPGALPVPAGFGGSCGCPRLVPLCLSSRLCRFRLCSRLRRLAFSPASGPWRRVVFPSSRRPWLALGSLCLALPCGSFLGGLSWRVLVPPGFWPSVSRRLVACLLGFSVSLFRPPLLGLDRRFRSRPLRRRPRSCFPPPFPPFRPSRAVSPRQVAVLSLPPVGEITFSPKWPRQRSITSKRLSKHEGSTLKLETVWVLHSRLLLATTCVLSTTSKVSNRRTTAFPKQHDTMHRGQTGRNLH